MRRKRLIKLTAIINVGIVVLGVYAAKYTEHVYLGIASAMYGMIWLMAFYMANIDAIKTEKPAGGAASKSVRIIVDKVKAIIADRKGAWK